MLARARGGMLPVQLLETSLEELLEAVSRQVELVPGARGRVSFCAAAGQHVRVDPVWFRQAIGNLIDNALRHTAAGSGLRTGRTAAPG